MKSTACIPPKMTAFQRLTLLFVLGTCSIPAFGQAPDSQVNTLEVLQNATFRQHVIMEDLVKFGTYQPGQNAGFRVETFFTGETTTEITEVIPEHTEQQSVWRDVYGYVDSYEWVEDWGWVTRMVDVPQYGSYEVTHTVPPEYDAEGNEIAAGYTYTTWEYGVTGTTQQSQEFWEVVGGHQNQVGSTWTVTGSELVLEDVVVPETIVVTGTQVVPESSEIHFTADHAEARWQWNNQGRKLLSLSTAGLAVHHPSGDASGFVSQWTPSHFEQSYASDVINEGHGTRTSPAKIEVWRDIPSSVGEGAFTSGVSLVEAGEVRLQSKESAGGVTSTVETRVSATGSSFSGTVVVNGVLLVAPQGGISMGNYTSGPRPPSVAAPEGQ